MDNLGDYVMRIVAIELSYTNTSSSKNMQSRKENFDLFRLTVTDTYKIRDVTTFYATSFVNFYF